METLDRIGGVLAFLIYALLLHQQNRIMQRQNEIMAAQTGSLVQQRPTRLRLYWPMIVMVLLTLLTLGRRFSTTMTAYSRHSGLRLLKSNKLSMERFSGMSVSSL